MRRLRNKLCGWFFASAVLLLVPAGLLAQDCDFMVVDAWWTPVDPDSIDVHFIADVVGPISTDPTNPTAYDMDVAIRFNGNLMETVHTLGLLRWETPNRCIGITCPNLVCRREEWVYKGVSIPQESRCTLDAHSSCGCPPLGTPVMHEKRVPKPLVPGTIEIEIIPLHLQSCNPINPGNDRKQIPYSPSPTSADPSGLTPNVLALGSAVPNPFHRTAFIEYQLPRSGFVRIELASVTGSLVRTLLSGVREAGRGRIRIDGSGIPAGVYFVRLISGGETVRRRVIFLH